MINYNRQPTESVTILIIKQSFWHGNNTSEDAAGRKSTLTQPFLRLANVQS